LLLRSRIAARFSAAFVVLACAGSVTSVAREARADEPQITADADAREKSRVAFRRGVAQLRSQDWTAARASFEAAWALYPHPSILLNLGIARLRTDEPVRAEQDLVRFLSEDVGASP
jgi:Tfp pilus assembly protein PilF